MFQETDDRSQTAARVIHKLMWECHLKESALGWDSGERQAKTRVALSPFLIKLAYYKVCIRSNYSMFADFTWIIVSQKTSVWEHGFSLTQGKNIKVFTGEIILTLKENFKIGVYKVKYIEPHHVLGGEYNPHF